MICEGLASWYNTEKMFTTMGPAVGETVSDTEEKGAGGGGICSEGQIDVPL